MTAVEHELSEPAQRRLGVPGPLMLSILGVLWRANRPLRMSDIRQRVSEKYKPVALTTVSSTLSRMKERGWISKPRDGVYQAVITRRNLAADISDKLAALIDDTVLAIEEV